MCGVGRILWIIRHPTLDHETPGASPYVAGGRREVGFVGQRRFQHRNHWDRVVVSKEQPTTEHPAFHVEVVAIGYGDPFEHLAKGFHNTQTERLLGHHKPSTPSRRLNSLRRNSSVFGAMSSRTVFHTWFTDGP